ncbi:MAG: hypothetical protein R3B83_01570 [Nitrospirales bacterium]|nr:hypothetical protein [Nitrospirales bacterium]
MWGALTLLSPPLPLHPHAIDLTNILTPPGATEWLGYDDLGRPILDRLLSEPRRLSSFPYRSLPGVILGSLLGTASGYCSGWSTVIFVRAVVIHSPSLPGLLLAIALAGALGPGIENVIIALATLQDGWAMHAWHGLKCCR